MRYSWASLFLGLAKIALAVSSTGKSVLVVLEPALKKEDFSVFFSDLEEQGYELTFRAPKDANPLLIEDDVPAYSNVVFFAPTTKSYAQDLTPQTLVSLLTKNTNLLIALSPKQTPLTSLASEFSLIPAPPGTPLISHFPKRDTPPNLIPIEPSSSPVLSPNLPPVWFSGASHALGDNPLLVPILSAPAESFASDTKDDASADALVDAAEKGGEGLWAGSSMGVVTGFQTKNGGRVTWAGGVDMFSNALYEMEISPGVKSGNRRFARDILGWTFQETLVLRVDNTTHHRVGETAPAERYTTNDQVTFSAVISRYDPKKSLWEPYSGITDLQLEFTMLDPHIRTALRPVAGQAGKYAVTFRVPDRHGVFKFVIDYKRKGWTHIYSATIVPVVPPRHDGYPRFLSAAWPYYAGAISTSVGFVLFSAIWLSGDAREARKPKGLKAE